MSAVRGLTSIVVATAVAGGIGYVITLLAYRVLGPAPYAGFAVFWATFYLVVGGLAGIQQEIARGTRSVPRGTGTPGRAVRFGIIAAIVIGVGIVLTGFLWGPAVFPGYGIWLVLPLAVGAAGYIFNAVLGGTLFGVGQWSVIAVMVVLDPLLRILLMGIALLFTDDLVVLAWAMAVPFGLVLLLLWPVVRRRVAGTTQLDVELGALAWNAARTTVAAVAMAVLVSGFPLVLGVASRGVDAGMLGELILTITFTRAPLIVSVMSLQSFLVVRFRDDARRRRFFWLVLLGISALMVVLGLLGLWAGPAAFEFVSGAPMHLDGLTIAILVASSALVAMLCVTGAALLARSDHRAYSLGWFAAAIATILAMVLPFEFLPKVLIALVAGPVVGLLLHGAALLVHRSASAEPERKTV